MKCGRKAMSLSLHGTDESAKFELITSCQECKVALGCGRCSNCQAENNKLNERTLQKRESMIQVIVSKLKAAKCWHVLAHRVAWVKVSSFMSIFFVLYAIALSSFLNTANNATPGFTSKQPKQPGGTSSLADVSNSSHYAGMLNIFMTAVDPAQSSITFAYSFVPSRQFLGTDPDDQETVDELKYHTLFSFGSTIFPQFNRHSETYGDQTRFANTVNAAGTYVFYPVDEYSLRSVSVLCRFTNITDDDSPNFRIFPRTSLSIAPRCSFGLTVRSTIPTTFAMDISDLTASTAQNAANGFSYDLSINIHRPFMFRLYPGFVIFAFWLIIIFELFLIFALSFFEFRKVSLQQSATCLFMLHANHRRI